MILIWIFYVTFSSLLHSNLTCSVKIYGHIWAAPFFFFLIVNQETSSINQFIDEIFFIFFSSFCVYCVEMNWTVIETRLSSTTRLHIPWRETLMLSLEIHHRKFEYSSSQWTWMRDNSTHTNINWISLRLTALFKYIFFSLWFLWCMPSCRVRVFIAIWEFFLRNFLYKNHFFYTAL